MKISSAPHDRIFKFSELSGINPEPAKPTSHPHKLFSYDLSQFCPHIFSVFHSKCSVSQALHPTATNCRSTPCRLFAIVYPKYPLLPLSISGSSTLHPQPDDVLCCVDMGPAYASFTRTKFYNKSTKIQKMFLLYGVLNIISTLILG
jgi:hypothetical protein